MENTPLSHTALHDVSLVINEGEFTAIAGETGAGKSTRRADSAHVRHSLRRWRTAWEENAKKRYGGSFRSLSCRHGFSIP